MRLAAARVPLAADSVFFTGAKALRGR